MTPVMTPEATVTKTVRAASRATALLAATGLLAAASAGCSSPDEEITLGKDWAGAQSYVVVDISGTEAVAGVDPRTHKAEPLALVPRHGDDDDVLAPQLARLSDGEWVLAVPRKDGRPDRLYRVDRKAGKLVEQGEHEALHAILPARTLIADAKGLDGSGAATEVLVKDAKSWKVQRKVKVPGSLAYASADPASDTVCLATGSSPDVTVHALDLAGGKLTSGPGPKGTDVQGVACSGGTPVAAGVTEASADGEPPAEATLKITATKAGTTITADTGRIEDVQAQDGTSTVAVALAVGDRTEIVEVDARTGKELRRTELEGAGTLRALRHTDGGWLAYTQDAVSLVDRTTGKERTFGLPGAYVAG
ncbi:hypothetical protein EF908_18535 [Streptomyces sp. WAC04770]|nr:hypothetical protein EF908_18535 [Streptomyces sp. WAC04770]